MTNNTSAITWAQVNGATGYKVYRNTSNSFVAGSLLLTTITNRSTVTYTDTGSATGAGLPPTSPTGTGLTLQGWSSQSGNALSIKNGAGSTTAGFTSGGRLFLASSAQFDGTTALMVSAGANTSVAQINRGLASQTADLLQFQDNNGLVNGAFNGTGNQLTLGRIAASGTVTQGKLLFADGTTDNYSLTLQSATLTANRTITLPNETGTVCTTGSICAGYAAAATSRASLMQIPGSTADNTITPTAASTTALTVNGTSNGTPATALIVNQSGGVNGMALNLTNPGSTQTSGLVITRNASGGTTTNALSITQSAGTLTNGLTFSGTIGTGINFSGTNFTNLISATNFSVSNAGTITTNGGYTQSGTTTNTLTGATTLSATGTALSITNDATIGRLGVNASTFGTVQKLGVNTPGTVDNTASAIIATGGTNNRALVLQGAASQIADLMRFQDSSGNNHAAFSALGNQLSFSSTAGSGTVSQGKLIFSDGTTDNFALTLQSTTLTANQTITFPSETGTVCTTASVCSGYASAAGYVQLQSDNSRHCTNRQH